MRELTACQAAAGFGALRHSSIQAFGMLGVHSRLTVAFSSCTCEREHEIITMTIVPV